jgi:hypothetical protein
MSKVVQEVSDFLREAEIVLPKVKWKQVPASMKELEAYTGDMEGGDFSFSLVLFDVEGTRKAEGAVRCGPIVCRMTPEFAERVAALVKEAGKA